MRMELPLCDLKTCLCYSDGNCLSKKMHVKCEYTLSKNCLNIAQELIEEYNNRHEYYDHDNYWNLGAVEALEELFKRLSE